MACTEGPTLRVPAEDSMSGWSWAISQSALERLVLLNLLSEPGIWTLLSSRAFSLRRIAAA
jgi:hypothetical protein